MRFPVSSKLVFTVILFTTIVVIVFSLFTIQQENGKHSRRLEENTLQRIKLLKTINLATDMQDNKSFTVTNYYNVSTTSDPFVLKDWKEGSFCNEFLSLKFPLQTSVCGETSDRVICYGTPHDDKMGSCIMNRIAIDVKTFYKVMVEKRDSVQSSNALWLLHDNDHVSPCPKYNFEPLEKYMAGGDYVKRLAKTSILSFPQGRCNQWINGTSFLFIGFDVHIYFKFLSWFSLYNGVLNYEDKSHQAPTVIIRIPETKYQFLFPEFERLLFPETTVVALQDLSASELGTICFEQIITTPWAFSTTAFRCKMADAIVRLRKKCYDCNSRGLPGTRFHKFRQRVLDACSLKDKVYNGKEIRSIVVQIRKAYHRFEGDKLTKFERVFVNSAELIDGLKKAFPMTNISTMYAEEMDLCDQIKLVHQADVFLGVHGAGLVHLWWLQDHALMFELVPRSQLSNPTFRMLSTLTGRRYYGYHQVEVTDKKVSVNVADVIKQIKSQF